MTSNVFYTKLYSIFDIYVFRYVPRKRKYPFWYSHQPVYMKYNVVLTYIRNISDKKIVFKEKGTLSKSICVWQFNKKQFQKLLDMPIVK